MATDLPTFVARHPAAWGIASGVLLSLAGLRLFAQFWLLLVGAIFGFANWYMWRRGGPAHEWRRKLLLRFPPRA